MLRSALSFALLLGALPAASWANLMQTCQAGNTAFPQLCPCAIERSQAAGIVEPALSRLLANQFDGVAIGDVQRYGLIFVECTQAAVLAGGAVVQPTLPAAEATPDPVAESAPSSPAPDPAPDPDVAAAPVPAPDPAAEPDPAPERAASSTPGLVRSDYRLVYADAAPRTPGRWSPFVVLQKRIPWKSWEPRINDGAAIENEAGQFLLAGCNEYLTPVLTAGPIDPTIDYVMGVITVEGRNGQLFEQRFTPNRIEGDLLQISLSGDILQALRRGDTVTLVTGQFGEGPQETLTFGLSGSSKAINENDARICLGQNQRAGHGNELVNGAWEIRYGKFDDGTSGPAAQFYNRGRLENMLLRCDGRLEVRGIDVYYVAPGTSPSYENRPNYGLRVDGGDEFTVHFQRPSQFATYAATRDPLPDALRAAMAAGQQMEIYPLDMEPGDGTYRSYELTGLGALGDQLICPSDLPRREQAVIDLTSESFIWSGGDLSPILPPDLNGNPIKTPFVSFTSDFDGAPTPSLYCEGLPFFFENYGAQTSSFDVLVVIDGDEDNGVVVDYRNYRSLFNPSGGLADSLGKRILAGETMRMTSLARPDVDILIPLRGASEALRLAGCTF